MLYIQLSLGSNEILRKPVKKLDGHPDRQDLTRDNEQAAEYLRVEIGQSDETIDWVAVRPSGLTDEGKVTDYEVYASPRGDGAFDPGKISRINTGHFMAELIIDDDLWNKWKGQMPVLYNFDSP